MKFTDDYKADMQAIEKTYRRRMKWVIAYGIVLFSLIGLQVYFLLQRSH